MKSLLPYRIFSIVSLFLFITACSSTKVIRQSKDTAIIQGMGETKIEARLKAEDKAAEMFGEYTETRECECAQEYSSYVSGGYFSNYSGAGGTYWNCTIFVKDKKAEKGSE